MPAGPSLTVVIAEDGVLLREGLATLLARFGHRVAATAGDAEGLVKAVEEHAPTSWSPTCGCRPASPTRGCGPP